jgi:lipid-A-disaccharide synthase
MKYFIIAGEQSGDLHGSNLVKEIIKTDSEAEIRCWGGDMMESAGARLMMHYKKTAFMGFVEVLKHLGSINRNMILCRLQINEFNPDVVILIDYPGFNLRIAAFAKKQGFRVFYYISPKFWAWYEKRVERIKKYVDRIYIIFPFEVSFYKRYDINAIYCGNPLLDEIERRSASLPTADKIRESLGLDDKPVIAILAGSRKSEITQVLPRMLEVVEQFPEYQFVLAGVRNLPDELYTKVIGRKNVGIIKDRTYEILRISHAALVTSGTATLETALFNVPQVVCYRGDFISMVIAWFVIKVKYISLVNLIMGKEVVKELVQYSLNRKNLYKELKSIVEGGVKRKQMLADYKKLNEIIGPSGASGRTARDMVKCLKG